MTDPFLCGGILAVGDEPIRVPNAVEALMHGDFESGTTIYDHTGRGFFFGYRYTPPPDLSAQLAERERPSD